MTTTRTALVETVEHGEAACDLHEWRSAAVALEDAGFRVERFTRSEMLRGAVPLNRSTPIVGDRQSLKFALRSLGVIGDDSPLPERHDYPPCLSPWFLERRVWEGTLGQAMATTDRPLFIKPRGAEHVKRFTGLVLDDDNAWTLERHPADLPVWCSDVLSFASEWRCYVLNDDVESVCYRGDEKIALLDASKVSAAIEALRNSGEGSAAYALDVGVLMIDDNPQSVLIELNDGFALGLYPGCPAAWYARMLVARWEEMVEKTARTRPVMEERILVSLDGSSRVLLRGSRATVSFKLDSTDENADRNVAWVDWRSGTFREAAAGGTGARDGARVEITFVLRKGKLMREQVHEIVADFARGSFSMDGDDWYEE